MFELQIENRLCACDFFLCARRRVKGTLVGVGVCLTMMMFIFPSPIFSLSVGVFTSKIHACCKTLLSFVSLFNW